MDFRWTDEAVDKLIGLHNAGTSMRDMAAKMGCTRNACIGKCNRLGLVMRPGQKAPTPPKPLKDEQKQILRAMWEKGVATTLIAKHLRRHVSTIRDYAAAMGLQAKPNNQGFIQKSTKRLADPVPKPAKPLKPFDLQAMAYVETDGVDIMSLNAGTCRWPLGGFHDLAERYCGAKPIAGKPYCPHHHGLAYVAPTSGRPASTTVVLRSHGRWGLVPLAEAAE